MRRSTRSPGSVPGGAGRTPLRMRGRSATSGLLLCYHAARSGVVCPLTRRAGGADEDEAMFIQTEATPNPATLKFLPGRVVMPQGTFDARDATGAAASPLAERMFSIPGVAGVFFGYDFITITKADGEWQHLKPAILGAIMEHFMSGAPILQDHGGPASDEGEEFFEEDDASTVATIKELLETRIRPAVAGDG